MLHNSWSIKGELILVDIRRMQANHQKAGRMGAGESTLAPIFPRALAVEVPSCMDNVPIGISPCQDAIRIPQPTDRARMGKNKHTLARPDANFAATPLPKADQDVPVLKQDTVAQRTNRVSPRRSGLLIQQRGGPFPVHPYHCRPPTGQND